MERKSKRENGQKKKIFELKLRKKEKEREHQTNINTAKSICLSGMLERKKCRRHTFI
jgi:hypothetical protein